MPPFFFFSAHRPLRQRGGTGLRASAAVGGSGRAWRAAAAGNRGAAPLQFRCSHESAMRSTAWQVAAARAPLLATAPWGGGGSPTASPLLGTAGRHAASPPTARGALETAWRRGMAPGPAAPGGPPARPARCHQLQGALTAGGSSWSAPGRQCPVPPPSPWCSHEGWAVTEQPERPGGALRAPLAPLPPGMQACCERSTPPRPIACLPLAAPSCGDRGCWNPKQRPDGEQACPARLTIAASPWALCRPCPTAQHL